MKPREILTSVKGSLSSLSWKIEKKTPEILLVTGIATSIAAVVLAIKATPKAMTILDEHKSQMDEIHELEKAAEEGTVEYSKKDRQKATITVYRKTGWGLTKCYAPSAIMLGGSIAAQVCGFKELSRRLQEASAAYAALATSYNAYRKRVAERLGDVQEREIFHNLQPKEVTTEKVDEDGNTVKDKHTVFVADDDDYSALFTQFDPNGVLNLNWNPDSEQNLTWLRMRQDYWTNVLKCRKGRPVWENEVRADLCVGCTQKGQVVGWTYEPNNPNHKGDNYIDFGLDPIIKAYKNGEEMPDDASFVLDFNVDGEVLYAT